MATRILFLFIVIVWNGSSQTQAQTQFRDCTCPGAAQDISSGGDGLPLNWHFRATLVQAGTTYSGAVFCYERDVFNKSNLGVYGISWRVAAYQRELIPPGRNSPSCVSIPGEMSPA